MLVLSAQSGSGLSPSSQLALSESAAILVPKIVSSCAMLKATHLPRA